MNRILLCIFLACFCLSSWAAGNKELYKCLIKGKVSYTDQMPDARLGCEPVFGRKPPTTESTATGQGAENGSPVADSGAAKPEAKTTPADKELEAKRKKLNEADAKKTEELKQAQQRIRDNNCQSARINMQTLQIGRVARVDEKGEKYYLDDAQIAKELAQAKKDVDEWCNK